MLRCLTKFLPRNQFARNIFALASGTVVAQAILIAASPVLTRLYTPADFGILSVFIATLGLFGSISALRLELAIPLPEDDRDATALTILALVVVAGLSAVLLFVTITFGHHIEAHPNINRLSPYLWLMPVAFSMLGLFIILNMWCIRNNMFNEIAKAKVGQSIVTVAGQVIGAPLGAGSLIAGRVVGQLVATAHLLFLACNTWQIRKHRPQVADLKSVAKTYRKFPLVSTWSALASSAGTAFTPLLFASYFGLDVAGHFAVTMTVMVAPMSIIGVAIQNAFYRKAVEAHRQGTLWNLILAVQARLVVTMLPLFLLMSFTFPDIFTFIFGENWEPSGVFAFWVLPWMFLQLTITPCTGIFPILDRLGTALLFDIFLAVAPLAALFIGQSLSGDPVLIIQLLSLIASLTYIVRLSVAYIYASAPAYIGVVTLLRWCPFALVIVTPMFALHWLSQDGGPGVITEALMIVATLGVYLVAVRKIWPSLPPLDIEAANAA
tara:strand:+ start:4519 stop:6000 length:1482 start_codon:yes stop_codon:yes gene_type:complete